MGAAPRLVPLCRDTALGEEVPWYRRPPPTTGAANTEPLLYLVWRRA